MRDYLFKLKIMSDGSPNEERMARIQKFLFKKGFMWVVKSEEPQYTHSPYLYAYKVKDKKLLSYGGDEEHFQNHEAPEWDISHLEI